jgi:anaerobic ribonucleoside-triphosphate reductase activating protein
MVNGNSTEDGRLLRIHHWLPGVRDTLGPGRRAVVWVQGCTIHCPGCMVPETWRHRGGILIDPLELARQILEGPFIDGVTVSGGEPTEQARAVASLLKEIREAGRNTWVYTGRTLEELVAAADPSLDELLSHVDVLVDGRYEREQAGVYRLRGSDNQRIIHLTDRIPPLYENGGESSRVEVTLDSRGSILIVGVPPPGFLGHLKQSLAARGLAVENDVNWT